MRFVPNLQNLVILGKAVLVPAVVGVAAIAEDSQGRVLLVRHSYAPGWRLPGGGADRGEPPEEAVMRELREEVDLQQARAPELLDIYVRQVLWFTNLVAVYRLRDAAIAFRPGWEITEAGFFAPDVLPPGTVPSARKRVDQVFHGVARDPYW